MDKIEERVSKIETDKEAVSYLNFYTETKEQLVKLNVMVCEIKEQMVNHLHHHQAITICALGATLAAVAGMLIMLIKK